MPNSDVARQWFVPGDGIDRHVIVTDIQRYLGNDATVRPGKGTGENTGVNGYWIKAYRNLTTAMIADLRADSARWRQEQRIGPVARDYVGSKTYHNSVAARVPRSRDGDSPAVEAPYGSSVPSNRDRMPVDRMPIDSRMPVDRMPVDRIPVNRMPADRMAIDRMQDDRMQIDTPSGPPQDRRYQADRNGYPSDPRYGADARGYSDARDVRDARTSYPPQEQPPFGRAAPVSSSYSQDSMYARSAAQSSQTSDGAPPGYVRQGNYYVPISSAEQPRTDYGSSHPYSQPAQPQRMDTRMDTREMRDPRDAPRDPRDARDHRDPRYGQDYQDPRYAYPSPATTTASLPRGEREPIAKPHQQSAYGSTPSQYDTYGNRPAHSSTTPGKSGLPSQRNSLQTTKAPGYSRDRPSESARNTRRRM